MLPAEGGCQYHILTYGCQMNVRDSETIAGFLEIMGYHEGPLQDADLIVFNTCTVRHSAENKVFGKLGEIARMKMSKPGLKVAFGGCMAQLPGIRKRLRRQRIDLLFGTHNLHEFPRLLEEVLAKDKALEAVWEQNGPVVEIDPALSVRGGGVSAFVNIMYGCNNFCTYCIVPYTRGRERSRQPEDIVREAAGLAERGCKEIILLGQNVNSYGRGLDRSIDFASLLEKVHQVEGIERIRFTTSHPKDVSDRLIGAMASLPRCCRHIHVAMQAGSNPVLKAMNRGYTSEQYLELIGRLRGGVPGIAISTDIIVGFPGETESQFEETLDMVEKIEFDAAYTFMYSIRSGTAAAAMSGQIDYDTRNRRLLELNRIQYAIARKHNEAMLGKQVEVLVEGASKKNPHRLTSRTTCNRIVVLEGDAGLQGQLVEVIIDDAGTFSMTGRLAGEPSGIEQRERKNHYEQGRDNQESL